MAFKHVPVMLDQAVSFLKCDPGKVYVDGTLGGSGHARAILDRILPDGILIGIDQDMDAVHHGETVLKAHASNIRLFHDNFTQLPEILSQLNISAVDGILVDLGLSLHQLEGSGRGFSFQKDEPLDMRMNTTNETTAEILVNNMPEKKMRTIFRTYGEEKWSGPIARRIIKERRKEAILTSSRLARVVESAIPGREKRSRRIHPATKVFMALRIAVNNELDRIDEFMKTVPECLNPGGRLCVISFHSLEDRIVKHRIREFASPCHCPPDFPKCACGKKATMRPVVKKTLRPSAEEISANPRARSAKLRVAERVQVSPQ